MTAASVEVIDGVAADAVLRLTGLEPSFVFERIDPYGRAPVQTHVGFGAEATEVSGDPADAVFADLRARLGGPAPAPEGRPPGAGGGILALLGYPLLAGQPLRRNASGAAPDAVFLAPRTLVTINHGQGRAWIAGEAGDDIRQALAGEGPLPSDRQAAGLDPEWTHVQSEADFDVRVRAAQALMRPGAPVEGAVLSVRLESPDRCDPLAAYRRLRAINPSTYMFLARSPSLEAWGATSLGLVRASGGRFLAETDGATHPYEKESFVWTPSDKEVVEYDVVVGALTEALEPLVDEVGLTFVSEMEERRFFNLAHLFAAISGYLRPGVDTIDLVRALSPHGAAVGHHRQPALDLIAATETLDRGPFAGTIGFFGFDGSVDTSAFTRSMWQTEAGMTVHAGAKVVPASVAVEEYRECVLKTLALRSCVSPR